MEWKGHSPILHVLRANFQQRELTDDQRAAYLVVGWSRYREEIALPVAYLQPHWQNVMLSRASRMDTLTAPLDADELARRALLKQGVAVAVNLRRHHNLIAWAKERGLFVRVDRATPWGNPFELGRDGDRETVIAANRDHYLPFQPPARAAGRVAREGAGVLVCAAGVPWGRARGGNR